MLDLLLNDKFWEGVGGVAAAVGAYLMADKVIKDTTGKHIHEYMFQWWRELSDSISRWCTEHANIPVARVMVQPVGYMNSLFDNVFTALYGYLPKTNIEKKRVLQESEITDDELNELLHDAHHQVVETMDPTSKVDITAFAIDQAGNEYQVEERKGLEINEVFQQLPSIKEQGVYVMTL